MYIFATKSKYAYLGEYIYLIIELCILHNYAQLHLFVDVICVTYMLIFVYSSLSIVLYFVLAYFFVIQSC